MVNRLLHNVELAGSDTVETVDQLRDALSFMSDDVTGDTYLAETLVVELLAEKLSDGSLAYSVNIRKAEPV